MARIVTPFMQQGNHVDWQERSGASHLVQNLAYTDGINLSVHAAKTQFSKLLDLVEDGEEVVIQRHGRPVAQLVPVRRRRGSALGAMRGQFAMVDGWERALNDEEAEAFWKGR